MVVGIWLRISIRCGWIGFMIYELNWYSGDIDGLIISLFVYIYMGFVVL